MYGEWEEVVSPNEVHKVIFLVSTDSNPETLKIYLMERFHKVLRNRAVQMETFDSESTVLLVDIIRGNAANSNLIYMMLKMFVYHTYMVAYHQMNNDEYRLLRFKLKKVSDPTAVY